LQNIILSRNFKLNEFIVSKDYSELLPEIWENLTPALIIKCFYLANYILQPTRNFLQIPIIILSGIRSPELNFKIKGEKDSLHLFRDFDAVVDWTCRPDKIWSAFHFINTKLANVYGELIIYLTEEKKPSFIHSSLINPRNKGQALVKAEGKFWDFDAYYQKGFPVR